MKKWHPAVISGMSPKDKRFLAYIADVRWLVIAELGGNDMLVAMYLPFYARECYQVPIAVMRADMDEVKQESKPSDEYRLTYLKQLKARGIKDYYSFELGGKMTVDKAIEKVEARLSRY